MDPTKRLRSLSVPRSSISLGSVIEEGIFGQIYYGFYLSQESVVVKTTKGKTDGAIFERTFRIFYSKIHVQSAALFVNMQKRTGYKILMLLLAGIFTLFVVNIFFFLSIFRSGIKKANCLILGRRHNDVWDGT